MNYIQRDRGGRGRENCERDVTSPNIKSGLCDQAKDVSVWEAEGGGRV